MALFKKLFLLLRIHHWLKSIFVLLGVIYTDLPGYWPKALIAAFVFCLIASAVYIYNDLQDIEEDRLHPLKYRRPLASGEVSIPFALNVFAVLLITGLVMAFAVSTKLAAILGVYLLINLLYNHWLRNVPVFDVICITSGFMLRILAGTIGIGLPITWWLTVTGTLFCFFIALSKRRLEMQLRLMHTSRAVLSKYHPRLLDFLIVSTAIGCFATYLLYIMYLHEDSFYFLLTIPFVAFGLWRFSVLTTKPHNNDDPVSLFLSDNLSRVNILCFFVLTMMALMK